MKRIEEGTRLVLPIAVLWGVAVLILTVLIWVESESGFLGDYYLVPWALITGAVLLAPSAYFILKKQFDLFHPLIFGVWSYLFPAFVGGALLLTLGLSDPYFMYFIEDPEYNIPLSLIYVAIGYLGMVAGFWLPVGGFGARKLTAYLPTAKWAKEDVWLPGLLLILAGIGVNIFGFFQGVFGYQRLDEAGALDAILIYLAQTYYLGLVLLWLWVFGPRDKNPSKWIITVFLLAMIPVNMMFHGSKSGMLIGFILVGFAFYYSGRKIRPFHGAVFAVLLLLAVTGGIIYGSTFRNLKGSEARVGASDYIGQIYGTLEVISHKDPGEVLYDAGQMFAARVETLSSLAVVVSNYEKLAPFEEAYGLKDNIVNETIIVFIPRFLWPDKPVVADARAYSELYFDFGESSFALTLFGDLLRNFGPIGIPLGMMLPGIYFRLIYDTLIKTPQPRFWKKAAYFPLLTLVSFEAFYSTLLPGIIRTGGVVIISLVIASLFTRKVPAED